MKKIILLVIGFNFISPLFAQRMKEGQYLPLPIRTQPLNVFNYEKEFIELEGTGKKILLLDFWFAHCGSCINLFPKLDSLQLEFKTDLQVLLVNSKSSKDDISSIKAVYARLEKRFNRSLIIPTLVNDSVLEKLFPHHIYPHEVWISLPDFKVISITSGEEVTAANVRKMLGNNRGSFVQKNDIDPSRMLYTEELLPQSDLLQYSIFLKGEQKGIGGGRSDRIINGVNRGLMLSDDPLLSIYKTIFPKAFPQYRYTDKRIIVEVSDSSKLWPGKLKFNDDQWYKENKYSIDFVVPLKDTSQLYTLMLNYVNDYSGFKGTSEERHVACWVVRTKTPEVKINSKGGVKAIHVTQDSTSFINFPLNHLAGFLEQNFAGIKIPVVDETNSIIPVDLILRTNLGDFQKLQEELNRNGLELLKSERTIPMFILREKGLK